MTSLTLAITCLKKTLVTVWEKGVNLNSSLRIPDLKRTPKSTYYMHMHFKIDLKAYNKQINAQHQIPSSDSLSRI